MPTPLHPLLQRPLRRLEIDPDGAPAAPAAWQQLEQRVSRAYADADRCQLERPQALASQGGAVV